MDELFEAGRLRGCDCWECQRGSKSRQREPNGKWIAAESVWLIHRVIRGAETSDCFTVRFPLRSANEMIADGRGGRQVYELTSSAKLSSSFTFSGACSLCSSFIFGGLLRHAERF